MKIGSTVQARPSRGAPIEGRVAKKRVDAGGKVAWIEVNTAPKGEPAVIKLFRPGAVSLIG